MIEWWTWGMLFYLALGGLVLDGALRKTPLSGLVRTMVIVLWGPFVLWHIIKGCLLLRKRL